jgi:hypothetical protein
MAPARLRLSLTAWIRPRLPTIIGVTVGSTSWAAAFALAWHFWGGSPPVPTAERVGYALQLAAWPALVLLAMICACFRLFDTDSAEDPLAGGESVRFRINQRVLTNTLEQGAVFVPLLLALATRLPPQHLKLLPIGVTVWCAGRLLFWAGYHVAPPWRAPGFDWTFYTSALLAAWFLYAML